MKKYFVALTLLLVSFTGFAAESPAPIKAAAQAWGQALSSGNAKKIVALYAPDAYLYATFQNKISSSAGLLAYFTDLMKHPDLKVNFQKQNIRMYHHTAINSGLYEFSYKDNGKVVRVPARFTFVYTEEPNGWFIVDHHSSVLPEK